MAVTVKAPFVTIALDQDTWLQCAVREHSRLRYDRNIRSIPLIAVVLSI